MHYQIALLVLYKLLRLKSFNLYFYCLKLITSPPSGVRFQPHQITLTVIKETHCIATSRHYAKINSSLLSKDRLNNFQLPLEDVSMSTFYIVTED